jgi:hypothetical protein
MNIKINKQLSPGVEGDITDVLDNYGESLIQGDNSPATERQQQAPFNITEEGPVKKDMPIQPQRAEVLNLENVNNEPLGIETEFETQQYNPQNFDSLDDLENGIDVTIDSHNLTPEEVEAKKKTAEREAKIKAWEEFQPFIETDPFVQSYIEWKKAGGTSFSEFVESVTGDDLSKLSEEDIFSFAVRNIDGITDDDEAEMALNDYLMMPDNLRAKTKKQILQAADSVRVERVKQLGLDIRKTEEIKREHQQKGHVELGSFLKKVEGKSYNGLVITPEMNAKIKDKVVKDFAYYDTREGYKVKESWDYHFWKMYAKDVINVNASQKLNAGREEVLESVIRPSADTIPRNNSMASRSQDDEEYRRASSDFANERLG